MIHHEIQVCFDSLLQWNLIVYVYRIRRRLASRLLYENIE